MTDQEGQRAPVEGLPSLQAAICRGFFTRAAGAKARGVDHIDFCSPCLSDAVLPHTGDDTLSRYEVLNYLRDLAELLQRVPPYNFGVKTHDLLDVSPETKLALLKVLERKPTPHRVKDLFGSWREAVREAGLPQRESDG